MSNPDVHRKITVLNTEDFWALKFMLIGLYQKANIILQASVCQFLVFSLGQGILCVNAFCFWIYPYRSHENCHFLRNPIPLLVNDGVGLQTQTRSICALACEDLFLFYFVLLSCQRGSLSLVTESIKWERKKQKDLANGCCFLIHNEGLFRIG